MFFCVSVSFSTLSVPLCVDCTVSLPGLEAPQGFTGYANRVVVETDTDDCSIFFTLNLFEITLSVDGPFEALHMFFKKEAKEEKKGLRNLGLMYINSIIKE